MQSLPQTYPFSAFNWKFVGDNLHYAAADASDLQLYYSWSVVDQFQIVMPYPGEVITFQYVGSRTDGFATSQWRYTARNKNQNYKLIVYNR